MKVNKMNIEKLFKIADKILDIRDKHKAKNMHNMSRSEKNKLMEERRERDMIRTLKMVKGSGDDAKAEMKKLKQVDSIHSTCLSNKCGEFIIIVIAF